MATALTFNGASTYVDLGNPATLQLTGSMTLSHGCSKLPIRRMTDRSLPSPMGRADGN